MGVLCARQQDTADEPESYSKHKKRDQSAVGKISSTFTHGNNMDKSDNLLDEEDNFLGNDLQQYRVANNQKTNQDVSVLGRGSLGQVVLMQYKKTLQYYAMKIIKKENLSKSVLERLQSNDEMKSLECDFIVQLHYAFQARNKLFMILDFMIGGELLVHLRRQFKFTEQQTRFYATELIIAIEYFHDNKIIYKDLKPENILLDQEGHIKITDSGISNLLKNAESNNPSIIGIQNQDLGTPEYIAPEIYQNKKIGYEVDWYSLGALIYEMLTGKPPFHDNQDNEQQRKLDMPSYFHLTTRDLVTKLLQADPKQRLGFKGAGEIKNHQFFNGIDWTQVIQKKIKPPFQPKYTNSIDLKNFDPKIVEEDITNSLKFNVGTTENLDVDKDNY